MIDNEIIKALECDTHKNCEECPCFSENCTQFLDTDVHSKDILDLINRQKANVEGLTNAVKYLNEQLSSAKAEAVKEFAERLKKSSSTSIVVDGDREIPGTRIYSISEIKFDNLAKEMVGES